MPRLSHIIVDGMAFVLVGIGLTAVVVGYERNVPEPAAQVAAITSDWVDPVTTGSIAPRSERASDRASTQPEPPVAPVGRSASPGTRAWTDPPRR